MELTLADKNRKEIRFARELTVDVEIGKEKNDFEMISSVSDWKEDIKYGCFLYIPDTEWGGVVGDIKSNTATGEIFVCGDTWRGMLAKKVICPSVGQDYKTVSGELNNVIRAQIVESGLSDLFVVPSINTGVSVTNFQFDRHCTLLSGLEKLLKSVGYRLDISYIKTDDDAYVRLKAVQIVDYSDTKEFSQDCKLNFTVRDKRNGINHLICLGKGELKDRLVKHLYVQQDGTIGTTQYYVGLDEHVEVYDDSNSEEEELITRGTERLKERMNLKEFNVTISDVRQQNLQIGDIVGGRDYITGLTARKPIVGKILTIKDGRENIEYRIEGEGED